MPHGLERKPQPTRDEALTALREAWPDWQVWLVLRAIGETWAARRHGDDRSRTLLTAGTPAELAELLAGVTTPGDPKPTWQISDGRWRIVASPDAT